MRTRFEVIFKFEGNTVYSMKLKLISSDKMYFVFLTYHGLSRLKRGIIQHFIASSKDFYATALKGCRGIVFTHGVRMGRRAGGKSLSGLYLRNRKV